MSTDLMPFTYEGQTVRTVVIDGDPWFVGADVAAALGYSNGRKAIGDHVPESHRGVSRIVTPSGEQMMTTLDEAGLYRLIMRANTVAAERFQEWVTATVLPTIRRTGSYGTPAIPDITTPAGVLAMAEQFAATARQLVASTQRIAELEPRAEVADRLLDADGDLSVADAAKALTRAGIDVGATRLFKALERLCWIYRGRSDGRWHVYQAAIEARYMAVIPQSHYHPKTGELVIDAPQPRVTPKGLERLMRELTPYDTPAPVPA